MTDMPTRSQEPCLNGLPAKALTDAPTVRFQRNSIEELRFTENRSANPCKSVIVVQKENSERAQDPGPQAVVTKDNPKGRHLCPGLFAPLLELQCNHSQKHGQGPDGSQCPASGRTDPTGHHDPGQDRKEQKGGQQGADEISQSLRPVAAKVGPGESALFRVGLGTQTDENVSQEAKQDDDGNAVEEIELFSRWRLISGIFPR